MIVNLGAAVNVIPIRHYVRTSVPVPGVAVAS